MNIDSDAEFEKYISKKTYAELKQISHSINKNLYRERHRLVEDRLKILKNATPASKAKASEVLAHRIRHGAFDLLFLLSCEFLVGAQGFLVLIDLAWVKGGADAAWSFWENLVLILWFIFIIISLFSLGGRFGWFIKYSLILISLYFLVPFIVPFVGLDFIPVALVPPVLLIFAVFWVNSGYVNDPSAT
jgi:hypothetical protein